MNRKLLALSVAALLATPALAAAENTGPNIYGRLHLSLNHFDNGGPGFDADGDPVPEYSDLNVSSNASRLGVKGSHDLGNSLTGIYQIESGLNADERGGQLATRNTFLGLKGGFGLLRVGYFDTPVKNIAISTGLFVAQVGDSNNLVSLRAFNDRLRNSVGYTSPSFGGLAVDLQYSTNRGDGAAEDDSGTFATALTYKSGPLYASLGYIKYSEADLANEPEVVRLGAFYDLGALRITGLVHQSSTDAPDSDSQVFGLGLRYTIGNFAVKGQYYTLDNDTAATDADLFAIGAEYRLAKNVTGYLNYGMVDNDAASAQRPWGYGMTDNDFPAVAVAGEDASAIGLGLVYNFN
jgi:predicted porin